MNYLEYFVYFISIFIYWSLAVATPLDKLTINLYAGDDKVVDNKQKGMMNYDGYQLHHVRINNAKDADQLEELKKESNFDFWNEIRIGSDTHVMVSPKNAVKFRKWLKKRGMDSTVKINDIGHMIEDQKKSADDYGTDQMHWSNYHSVEVIYKWLNKLEKSCDFCEIVSIGKSNEGQDMKVMKICRGDCGNKTGIWIDSGLHAREWISPAVGTWILNELVTNDTIHPELTNKLDWYFLPIANPDGYRLSRNDDRMWRKTTSQHPGVKCKGTDLNRNWDFHWGERGSSKDSCDSKYHGPNPFSEIEARNVRDYILKENKNHHMKLYLSLHSYKQQILSAWGFTKDPAPGNDAMQRLGKQGAEAIKAVHGKTYEVGCSPCVNDEPVPGCSKDWALKKAGIPYSYTFESRDTGDYGHLLPANQIIPSAEEAWAFIASAGDQLTKKLDSDTDNSNDTKDKDDSEVYSDEDKSDDDDD